MTARAILQRATPLIPAGVDLAAALDFYREALGFEIVWHTHDMAGVRRDGVEFNLVRNGERAWADNASVSVGVDDLDALYDEYRNVDARVGPLETKSWGRREFHMILHSGVCLQFYRIVG